MNNEDKEQFVSVYFLTRQPLLGTLVSKLRLNRFLLLYFSRPLTMQRFFLHIILITST